MNLTGFCPQCNNQISSDRHLTGFAICSCGWYDQTPVLEHNQREEKKIIASMTFAAIFLALLYGHMLNWGSYAFAIPFVKAQQITGTLSKQGYDDLAQVCIQLNKWSCAQTAYIDQFHQTGDAEALSHLGHLQVLLNQKEVAQNTYASYFKFGGKDADAAIEYGSLLEASGQFDLAMKSYENAVTLRPQVLPIKATTAIVRLLIKTGKYEVAYQRILDFHASAGNADGYLNTELAQLEARLEPSKKLGHKNPVARNDAPTNTELGN